MDIREASDAELKKELERRESEARENSIPKPIPFTDYNLNNLVSICAKYLQEVYDCESEDSDTEYYVFESALELVYGNDIWKWISDNT